MRLWKSVLDVMDLCFYPVKRHRCPAEQILAGVFSQRDANGWLLLAAKSNSIEHGYPRVKIGVLLKAVAENIRILLFKLQYVINCK